MCVEIIGIKNIPLINEGDDLPLIIANTAEDE